MTINTKRRFQNITENIFQAAIKWCQGNLDFQKTTVYNENLSIFIFIYFCIKYIGILL